MPPEATIPALEAIIPAAEKQAAPSAEQAASIVVELFKRPVVAVTNNIVQIRAERSADLAKQKIVDDLQKLRVERELEAMLSTRFGVPDYRLDSDSVDHPYGTMKYQYTALRRNGVEAALLQLPPSVFDIDDDYKELYIGDFTMMLKAFRKKKARMFSKGKEGITDPFIQAMTDESQGADWRFINWVDIILLTQAKREFWRVFSLPDPISVENHTGSQPKKIPIDRLNLVEEVLMRHAQSLANQTPVSQTFGNWVTTSGWPDEWVKERSTGWHNVAPTDAHDFVEYMRVKGTFPAGHSLAGRSVLGEFLRKVLVTVGGDDGYILAQIVVEYTLVPDADAFKKYYTSR
jgi:hypothetical protein